MNMMLILGKSSKGKPSRAFGILEVRASKSIASSRKCSGMQENSMGHSDGKGILNPPTRPTDHNIILICRKIVHAEEKHCPLVSEIHSRTVLGIRLQLSSPSVLYLAQAVVNFLLDL